MTYLMDIQSVLKEVEKAPQFFNVLRVVRIDYTGRKLCQVVCIVFPINFDGLSGRQG